MARKLSERPLREVWSERDTAGVQDFVMLEHFRDEGAFIHNLSERFKKKLVYTYIGNVLVAVNPYEELGIYSPEYIGMYRNVNLYELPPHVFAISDQAYRTMRDELGDQCILISGESGAGKTESSKKILQFLAHNSANAEAAGTIRDRLLQCNPILESFGNAKTIRNDNSSRFGKYMEVQFDFKGEPLGGRILNYLLEKSRVVSQMPGERNFHVFYLLLSGGGAQLLSALCLRPDPATYNYLRQGNAVKVAGMNDTAWFKEMAEAFKHLAFTPKETQGLYEILATVLHLGQVEFKDQGKDQSSVVDQDPVLAVSALLGLGKGALNDSLTHQTITARGQSYRAHLNRDKAAYARDALAKALYNRMFTWLVSRLNTSLQYGGRLAGVNVMGLLDIYGFEIMQINSFEQLCINYCNEKLQQVFVELTLKQEQEEYAREGIAWESVDYFDNKIICAMVEEKHKGIVAVLDEECLRPGDVTDDTFLDRLDVQLKGHKHYRSFATSDYAGRKTIERGQFQIAHYAGDVVYSVAGFIDKNNDLLFRDLKETMSRSTNAIVASIFPAEELSSLKRPLTAATQFKNSLNALVDILMVKTPWYVRCIKPNHNKRPATLDPDLLRHQIKYLGLMENLRIRRAGFAYRRPFEKFLERYKCLCPQTWPNFRGSKKDGVSVLLRHLKVPEQEYRIGQSKVFIRSPKVLFAIEAQYVRRRQDIATKLQAYARGFVKRKQFQAMRAAVTALSKHWRRLVAQRLLLRMRTAREVLRRFVRGYRTRNQPRNADNAMFLDGARALWLSRVKEHLPTTVRDHSWCPSTPPHCVAASELLRKMHKLQQARALRAKLSPELLAQLQQKVVASDLFREKKLLYPNSVAEWFRDDRLVPVRSAHPKGAEVQRVLTTAKDDSFEFITPVQKYDRTSYHPRPRVAMGTAKALYFLDAKSLKLVVRVDYSAITGISVSKLYDSLVIIHTNMEAEWDRGDFVLSVDRCIEFVTLLAMAMRRKDQVRLCDTITQQRKGKPSGIITFVTGPPAYTRTKEGMEVSAPALEVPAHYKQFMNPPPKLRPQTGQRKAGAAASGGSSAGVDKRRASHAFKTAAPMLRSPSAVAATRARQDGRGSMIKVTAARTKDPLQGTSA